MLVCRFALGLLVGCAVLMHELPRPPDQDCLEIIIRIAPLISGRPVADLQVDHLFCSFVDEAMAIPRACLEPRAHAGRHLSSTLIGMQRGVTLQDVDELVLLRVSVAQGRDCVGCETSEIDTEVRETEQIAQRMFLPSRHS